MNLESLYYENSEFWTLENTNDEDIKRFEEICKSFPKDAENVLDVACGNGLFLNYLNNLNIFKRLHGLERSKEALKYVRVNKTHGSADLLPFKDNEFDLVTILEAIEHFPCSIYEKSLKELCRVSNKYVLITVPNDQKLELTLIACPQCKTSFNPDYHMRSFTDQKMKHLLDNFGFKAIKTTYLGKVSSFKFQNLLYHFGEKSNPFPHPILCPVCGYNVPPKSKIRNINNKTTNKKTFKSIIKKVFPKKTRYRWILALYEKV